MKKTSYLLIALMSFHLMTAQVGITADETDRPEATLDIKALGRNDVADGILIPRIDRATAHQMGYGTERRPKESTLIYIDDFSSGSYDESHNTKYVKSEGYYYWKNSVWIPLLDKSMGVGELKKLYLPDGVNYGLGLTSIREKNYNAYNEIIGNGAIDLSFSTSPSYNGLDLVRGKNGASGYASVALGHNLFVAGRESFGIGNRNQILYKGSGILGNDNLINSMNSFVFGNNNSITAKQISININNGSKNMILGFENSLGDEISSLSYNFLIGHHLKMNNETDYSPYGAIVIGQWNAGLNYNNNRYNKNNAFVVATGYNDAQRYNSFTILANGEVGVGYNEFGQDDAEAMLRVNGAIKISNNQKNGIGSLDRFSAGDIICNEVNQGTLKYTKVDSHNSNFQGCRKINGSYQWVTL